MRRVRGLLLGACLACGGGIPLESVPDDPIAFVRQEAAKGQLDLDVFREGIQLKAFEEAGNEHKARLRTSLSLLNVPRGEIRRVPDASEGSLPLDWSADGYRLLIGRMAYAGGPIQLYTWNRLTGVYKRLKGAPVGGSAALGIGPIRLAGVGRVPQADGSSRWGVMLQTDGGQVLPLSKSPNGSEQIDRLPAAPAKLPQSSRQHLRRKIDRRSARAEGMKGQDGKFVHPSARPLSGLES